MAGAAKVARVLVTGGANGVGRGIVDRFLREGAMVAYADLTDVGVAVGFAKPALSAVDSRVSVVAPNIPTKPGWFSSPTPSVAAP
jgi:NAD(P)-dependent dehydrogenase (short-subunit alcohol dehydrogenase family)